MAKSTRWALFATEALGDAVGQGAGDRDIGYVDELFSGGQQQVENLKRGCSAVEDQGDAAGRDAAAQVHLNPARLFEIARGGLPAGLGVAVENQGRGGAVGPGVAEAAAMV